MTDRTRGYALRLEVTAPVAQLWRGLIDPALLSEWYARDARIDARAGGRYRVNLHGDQEREAHIDVYLPPNRLRLIYMPARIPIPPFLRICAVFSEYAGTLDARPRTSQDRHRETGDCHAQLTHTQST
jgi:hypothetical protein